MRSFSPLQEKNDCQKDEEAKIVPHEEEELEMGRGGGGRSRRKRREGGG